MLLLTKLALLPRLFIVQDSLSWFALVGLQPHKIIAIERYSVFVDTFLTIDITSMA